MRLFIVLIISILIPSVSLAGSHGDHSDSAMAAKHGLTQGDGLVHVKSNHNVAKTADRLAMVLESKGMKLFARIDHAQGAASVGKTLRPTELMIFGNPKVGTPVMQCAQSVAIDLPQKMLIWEDESGHVWLSYNAPSYLAARHEIKGCKPVLAKITGALSKFAHKAAAEK